MKGKSMSMSMSMSMKMKMKMVTEDTEKHREEAINEEPELEFLLQVGLVKDFKLSKPFRARLGPTDDKWNLFLPATAFDPHCNADDVRHAVPVRVYDTCGHEFEMMLKKWERRGFYVLNRGWATFCDQRRLSDDDIVAVRTFRHAVTHGLCFVVTFKRVMRKESEVIRVRVSRLFV
ncbi:hypothetical protein Fmac_030279 [Flemingia macrophylla]|uniref:TF-B3 domain-containing protein n=1 Tax=Flemingia macrophylla TaxID=520843 RepID=A0ABD1LCS0_9FABA